ncbi:MAG: PAS domain-containing protein [Alphaproteobacteria bacterium]
MLRDPIPLVLGAAIAALVVMALDPTTPAWLVALEGAAAMSAPVMLAQARMGRRRDAERAALCAVMLDTEPNPRLVTAADGSLLYVNIAARRLWGGLAPIAALRARAGGDPRAVEAIDRLATAAAGRVADSAEIPLGGAGGEAEWFRVAVRPLAAMGPAPRAGIMVWSVEDVTARRAIEEVLRRDQEDLTDFFDFAPVGLFTADAERCFRFVNQRLAEWLGRSPESLRGLPIAEVMAAPPGPEVEEDGRGEVKFLSHAGDIFQAFVSHALYDDGGEICTRSVVVRDVMPEREWKQALRDAESRFRWLFDEAPVGVVLLDLEGAIADCNPTFADMVGESRGFLVHQPLADRIAREDRSDVAAALSKVVMGIAGAAQLEVRFATSRERAASLFISPTGDDDEVTGLVLHFIDTTEQRSLEIQFAQAQKMQAMGQLAGGVAHDFNNLLTAMIGFCDLLLQRHGAGDPSFADIMQIKQNANRAANLIRQLLAFSRRQPLQPRMLDVAEALAELSHLLRRLLGETVGLKLVHGRDLGLVRVDPGQFDQVIINLAVNARDAMQGGGVLTIRTGTATFDVPTQRGVDFIPPGEYVMVEVNDTGCGIGKEDIGRIFEPFFSTKQGGAGTGLGLSTVYGIIRQTDGFILVDSALGEGATFTIYLPRYEAEPATEATFGGMAADGAARTAVAMSGAPQAAVAAIAASVAEGGGPTDLTGAGTVLLVEDEDAVRTFAARALRNKGYTVIEAGNGEAALDAVRDTPAIDVLLSDMVMPGMDGATLARLVRADWPNIRIILMSGYSDEISRGELSGLPDVHFLAKPFSLEILAGTVKEVAAGALPRGLPVAGG